VKLPSQGGSNSVDSYMRSRFPYFRSVPPSQDGDTGDSVGGPIEILVAGCGTGQHSIAATQRFENARVLAIDLSLTSLCYAKRKTRDMGLENIQYAQADIMGLNSPDLLGRGGRMFDIIESVGVLHHLADPLAGWRKLLSLLRPGGFMRVGLYSEYARRNEAAAKGFIAERGYRPNPEDIRRFRQDVISDENALRFSKLLSARDFYTISECRDLLFHVKEHCYTLPQLKKNLRELDLAFIGFSVHPGIATQYRKRFPHDPSQTDLDSWHIFETEHPDTFTGMYQFWAQKTG